MPLSMRVQRKLIRLINDGVWRAEDGPLFSTRQVMLDADVMAFEFFCPHCKVFHQHTADAGHRIPHCHDKTSPWADTGYSVKLPSKWSTSADLVSQNAHEASFWVDWYTTHQELFQTPQEPHMTERIAPVQFYKDGDSMGIRTTLSDPGEFLNAAAARLSAMIDDGLFASDWEFQLSWWLPQIVEIACKLKGYKADVREDRLITAGSFEPPKDSLVGVNKIDLSQVS